MKGIENEIFRNSREQTNGTIIPAAAWLSEQAKREKQAREPAESDLERLYRISGLETIKKPLMMCDQRKDADPFAGSSYLQVTALNGESNSANAAPIANKKD